MSIDATVIARTDHLIDLDGTTEQTREVIGGKAFSIQRMRALGIPVPPAFVLTTQVCRDYHAADSVLSEDVWSSAPAAVARLGEATGRRFGSTDRPLLLSVRSGAATSMPGMMDTVLNLGMTAAVEQALAEETGDPAYAADTRHRFEEQFEKVVGCAAPEDPWEQLRLAIVAVLDSWHSSRAVSYRASRGIPADGGTAVTVQAMVFGNLDDRSGTGVLFSRNPLTGESAPYGEWLPRGQGEDVVSGRADALPLGVLEESMPDVHAQLMAVMRTLEIDGRDVQDIEFTVQTGRLWLLQSRSAKRSPEAALRHAVQLEREGLLSREEAMSRITRDHPAALQRPRIAPAALPVDAVAQGKPACPGLATGVVVTSADEAEDLADQGVAVVLARPTTDPDDVAAMSASAAVLTELGGSTSHAAVVCREMAVPCVVGCGVDTVTALSGLTVTVDATSGRVYLGELPFDQGLQNEDPDLAVATAWFSAEES